MTPEERDLIDNLADAYNAFCQLPREHPSEVEEFAGGIHVLQHLVASRSAWRSLRMESIGDGVVRER